MARISGNPTLLHGHKREGYESPTYTSWRGMMDRGRKTEGTYAHVSVCKRWHDFRNFLEDMGERPEGRYSIDRHPNKKGDYEPGNCRWLPLSENCSEGGKRRHL